MIPFQPFVEFTDKYLAGLAQTGYIYIVTQTYKRGVSIFVQDIPIVLMAYNDTIHDAFS